MLFVVLLLVLVLVPMLLRMVRLLLFVLPLLEMSAREGRRRPERSGLASFHHAKPFSRFPLLLLPLLLLLLLYECLLVVVLWLTSFSSGGGFLAAVAGAATATGAIVAEGPRNSRSRWSMSTSQTV